MQRMEVSSAVRHAYMSLGGKGLIRVHSQTQHIIVDKHYIGDMFQLLIQV
jgi:hypothetical protein